MIVTKKALSRRTVLKGLGVSLSLPLLDGMVPALSALSETAAKSVTRFGVVYVPNGMIMKQWTPSGEGAAFELSPILQPLAPFRKNLLVLTGLNSTPPADNAGAPHARASTKFLTDVPPSSKELRAGTSMDQIAARVIGQRTQLASLELALESVDSGASCDSGSCANTGTISWSSPTNPLPMENNPRVVFERLFGDSETTDPAVRQARMATRRSLLDSVMGDLQRLKGSLGPSDRARLGEYADSIRDIERRIQNAESQQGEQALPSFGRPSGVPATFEEHVKLMFDLQVLAYQCDLTRVITFMIGREFSGRTYPEIGVTEAHHPVSHHQNDPVRMDKVAKINAYHASMFAYYLEKLRSTPDGDGSLLDHMLLLYGAGMSDSNAHDPHDLPLVLAGGGKGGKHIRYSQGTPLANLHLTLLDRLGVPVESIGNSTGHVELTDV